MSSPTSKQEPLAAAALTLACLATMFGVITGIPAIICGHIAKNKIRKDTELSGSGLATAGLIIGYIFSIMSVLLFFLFVATPGHIQK